MDYNRNHGVIDMYAHEAQDKQKEYAVVLLLDENGEIVDQYGFGKEENVQRVKNFLSEKENRHES
jgi:hypothetical protein